MLSRAGEWIQGIDEHNYWCMSLKLEASGFVINNPLLVQSKFSPSIERLHANEH
jgi:hypothetical protein